MVYQSRLSWGLVTPLAICSSIWSLNLRRASLTSGTYFLTICLSRGASSLRAVSFISSNHDLIKMPLSGYSWKFSATLSTMIVLARSRPILERSFTNTGPLGLACCLYNLYLILFSLSIWLRTQSAYYKIRLKSGNKLTSCIAAVKMTIS